MRALATILVLLCLGATAATVGAVPLPQPTFWSVARCERVLPEEHPKMRQVMCVPTGGPSTCRHFFMAHVRVLATDVAPARFGSVVAPIAARLKQQESAICSGT